MNCFTFEASFYAWLNENRQTVDFSPIEYQKTGEHLVNAFYEYMLILEEEERQKKIRDMN